MSVFYLALAGLALIASEAMGLDLNAVWALLICANVWAAADRINRREGKA